eukprot:COSAG04_NODE_4804_length_1884_cov_1.783436_2_plen_100_part_00
MQGELATAEERLRSARLEAALAEHGTKVAAGVSRMREGGESEHDIAVYEAEQAVEEAKIEACLPRPQVAPFQAMSSGAGLRLVTCLGCTYALLRGCRRI